MEIRPFSLVWFASVRGHEQLYNTYSLTLISNASAGNVKKKIYFQGLKKKDVAKPVIWKEYKPKGVCEEPTVAQATAILPVAWLLLLAALVLGNPA